MAGSIQNRESFLSVLTEKLGDTPFEPYVAPTDLPVRHLAECTIDELLVMAKEQAGQVSANWVETKASDLSEVVNRLIQKSGGGQVMIPDDPQFEQFGLSVSADKVVQWQKGEQYREENIMNAQHANVAVAFAQFFLAESATIAVESSAGQGRSIHFLPTHYISIIPQSRIVPDMQRAAKWYDAHKKENTTLHFISGPSNSGDIEMQLVIGLHGPLEIFYVIVKDI
ncbi:lactate utilization protein C [Lactococcus hircilactis]|uniref:Lactate utilization protein C n=1 Tax=Lactococcus hircilactis TaxID=1494462 RepID=A0A7X2CZT9_9LACT|nr:lactate utilization protein C [Lactococcus hircilactis]MQW38964.1 lactate utilization protein C [Lactococcus hircilactis]